MKRFCLIFAILSFLLFVPAVAQSYKVDPNTPGVFLYAEQFPFMVGGDEAAERYIRNNVKYPWMCGRLHTEKNSVSRFSLPAMVRLRMYI